MPKGTSGHLPSGACDCGPHVTAAARPAVSRRDLLAGGAAALTVGALAGSALPGFGQERPRCLDVHHHIAPPSWLDAIKSLKRDNAPIANWSVQKTLDDMDKGGVATAITSPTTPQVNGLDAARAARVARESNEFAKRLEADHPGRFGTFAMLPLPHVDASLEEIAYAFDTLHVDGIGCMTSYGDKWLGYSELAPVWEELNRRKATVYTHPTEANCCRNLVRGISDSYIEFGTDTARSIASLVFSGTSQKYPDINWIWSHGGGALTAFAERFLVQVTMVPPYRDKFTRDSMLAELKRFYYDTAAISGAVTLEALTKLVSAQQIVYGTDFPYRTAADHTRGVTAFFKGDDLARVERENALRLLPRLKSA